MVQQVASLDRPIDNSQPELKMEEEIDLRQYVAVLVKYWYWIVGLAVVAAVVAFGVSTFTPPTYQATALVTAIQPRYQLQFDPRFQNIPEWSIPTLLQSQYRTYSTLATSDDLLRQVADRTGWSLSSLRGTAQATAGSDPSLLTLTVKGENAQEVTQVVNTWAEIFVATTNTLYGGNNEVEQLKQQQESAAQALAQIDADLTAFREENGFGFSNSSSSNTTGSGSKSSSFVFDGDQPDFANFGLIGQRLQAKQKLLTDYEAELVRLNQIQREVELLSTNLITSPVLIAGLLSEMINRGIVRDSPIYQIRLDSVDPATSLAAMERALTSRVAAIEVELEPLPAEIAALQTELAAKQVQLEQLSREREVKTETYAALSHKVQEAQLDASGTGQVQIASQAATPTAPVSPRRTLNAAVAGALGLMVGVFGAFAVEWWRKDQV
jgi:uncharacterized protein involved in exopolysaccharide biosynthesis